MKMLAIPVFLLFAASGCRSVHPHGAAGAPPLMSEREYAQRTEAVAQDLYKTGRASSLLEARSEAAAQVNQEWAATERARAQKQKEDKFAKDVARIEREKNDNDATR